MKKISPPDVVVRPHATTLQSYGILARTGRPALLMTAITLFIVVLGASLARATTAPPVEPVVSAAASASDTVAGKSPQPSLDDRQKGDPDDAAERNAPAAAVNPTVGERLLLANGYLEKGRPDDALSVVNELVGIRKLKPVDRAQIHRFRGYILIAKNDIDGAGGEFEAALAEHALEESASQPMIYSLAQIYTQSGHYDRARDLIDRWFATATDPKPEAYFLKAMVLVQQEAFHDALEPARIAVERSPEPRESWLQLLTAIEFQLQDYPAVAETLKRLIALAPGTKRYWVQLATIQNTIGQDNDALATLGVAETAGMLQEDREYRQRARQCFVKDIPSCCTETLEKGMAAGAVKQDADSWQLLANCYIASRDIDRALEPLAKAGELADDGKSYLLLGQIHLQKEHFPAAREALAKARAKAKPEQRPAIDLLTGIAELGSEHFDAAETAFQSALADDKTRPAAESYLKHLEQKRALRALHESSTLAGNEQAPAQSATIPNFPSM